MPKPLLVIGNKNYSSWSLRPYMILKSAGIAFDEKLVPFGDPKFKSKVKKYSDAGLVPVLVHNGIEIWDTLAIAEYIAETWPEKQLWPKSKAARAVARSVSAEMHSGFRSLRSACPMNIRRSPKAIALADAVHSDIKRIDHIWSSCRKTYGKTGPYLFGKFSIADAMFAPVASRFKTFDIKLSKPAQAYRDAILGSSAFKSWEADALKERWIVPEDEVD
jgi:glutathione S-transferase